MVLVGQDLKSLVPTTLPRTGTHFTWPHYSELHPAWPYLVWKNTHFYLKIVFPLLYPRAVIIWVRGASSSAWWSLGTGRAPHTPTSTLPSNANWIHSHFLLGRDWPDFQPSEIQKIGDISTCAQVFGSHEEIYRMTMKTSWVFQVSRRLHVIFLKSSLECLAHCQLFSWLWWENMQ